MLAKSTLILTLALWLLSKANSQADQPRIVVSPTSQCANQTSFLSLTCIAYVGLQANYQPTTLIWYNGVNEQLYNSSQVTIYSNMVVIDGMVFIESTLEARTVYSHLTGQSSCVVANARGQDRASWILIYDNQPPVTVIMKPANQSVNYTSTVRMTCQALVHREVSNDTVITWWGEFGQITNNTETGIFTNRIWSGGLQFVESLLEVCSVNYMHIGNLSCIAQNSLGRDIANWTAEPPVRYPPPQTTITQSNVRLNYRGTLNATCNVSIGPQEAYRIDPTEFIWLDANGQQIMPIANEINIYRTTNIINGNVFMTLSLGIDSIGSQHVGDLQCVARSIFGRDNVTLTVEIYETLTSPELLLTPFDQSVDCRSGATVTCAIAAFPIPEVQWYFNGVRLDNGASDNVYINAYYGSAVGLNFTETYLDICDFGDDNVGYYSCSAFNTLGNYTSDAVWIGIDPQSAPPVTPPMVNTADRVSNSEALVRFEPLSLGNFEIAIYIANDSTTPYLTEKFDSFQTTIDQPQKMFMGLNTCQRYWVVVTGRYCGKSGSTDPMLIGFQDANPYELTLTLGEKDGPCTSWIKNDPDTKVADMEAGLMIRSSECGFDIPCFDGSTWKCKGEGPLKVTFETQIVGYSQQNVGDIKKCIDDWITAGKQDGQSFTIGASNLTVVNIEQQRIMQSIATWVWIVIVVGVVLLVACIVIAILVIVIVSRQRSNMTLSKKERLVNSNGEEEGHEDYTVAVVDNPLYAENEGELNDYLKEEFEEDKDGLEVHEDDVAKTDI